MKKLFIWFLMMICWGTVAHGFSGGDGTEGNPHIIAIEADLTEIMNPTSPATLADNLAAHYKQTAHLNLSSYANWLPIAGGGATDIFTGSYDGQHYSISSLTINLPGSTIDLPGTPDVGLFGHVGRGAVIKNVVLDGVSVVGGRGTGSLIGRVTGDATTLIERCSALNGTVTGDAATGGLVGSHNSWRATFGGTDNPVISQCFADIDVLMSNLSYTADPKNKLKYGGLAGCSQKGTIMDSYARGSVTATATIAERVGGLAGCAEFRGELIRCYSTGSVTIDSNLINLYGGLIGNIVNLGGGNNGVVVDSYWDTVTSGQTTSAAGFPRTTTEMTTQSTFMTFDFSNIWAINPAKNGGYPYLIWEDYTPTVEPPAPIVVLRNRRGLFLDGIIDHVLVPHDTTLDVSTANKVTVEAWIKKASDQTDAPGTGHIAVVQKHESYNLFLENGNQPAFSIVDEGGATHTALSGFALTAGKWYHLVGTFDNSAAKIFINGFEYDSVSATGIQDTGSNVGIGVNVTGLTDVDGNLYPSEGFLHGAVDEIRIWNVARSDTDIRATMCRKLNPGEPAAPDFFTNLMGYWRFEEAYGLTCVDDSINNDNIGTLHSATRVCSSAPIGDDSSHDYTDADGFMVDTEYPAQDERMIVSAEVVAANWSETLKSGLQVYRVNAVDDQRGPLGTRLFSDRGYWGVFVTGGDSPTYKMQYTYDVTGDGVSSVGSETDLRLNWRHGNCENWKSLDATTDLVLPRTLTKGGLSGTEFILGTDLPPRNAILFDGGDDYINVPDDPSLQLTDTGTLEAWIYVTALPADQRIIINKGDATNGYALAISAAGNITLNLYNSVPPSASRTSAAALLPNIWYHVSATWDNAAQPNIYINGVLSNGAGTGPGSSGNTAGGPLTIGGNGTTGFHGRIDEVRVWNAARNQAAIRDTMCKKVISTDSGYANLVGYWRFDEETDSCICPDETIKDNDGIMNGFGTCDNDLIRAPRICSSAPIGDDSAYGYHDPLPGPAVTPVIAQLAHLDGDYMFVTQNSGIWDDAFSGIHVYRVDEAPVYQPDLWEDDYYDYQDENGMVPPEDLPAQIPAEYWSSIDYYRYWGVFVTDPVNNPSYDVVYDYTGNPMTPDDDSVVGLARRDEFCDRTWEDSEAALDIGADTLSLTNETGTEYVFGGQDAPLAITLASFTAQAADGCADIKWQTATEIGTTGFYLWRSDQKIGGYTRMDETFTPSKAIMEVSGESYEYLDCDTENGGGYYKLEEISEGNASGAFYGPVGPVCFDSVENVKTNNMITTENAQNKDSSGSSGCFIDATRPILFNRR